MKCCICGKEIKQYGNNPEGALDEKANLIKWKAEDRCCDECNVNYVIKGRIALMYKMNNKSIIKAMPKNLVKKEIANPDNTKD